MTRQTAEQINARERNRYLLPGMKEKARLKYLKRRYGDQADCQPDYGIVFQGFEVQKILTKWGG